MRLIELMNPDVLTVPVTMLAREADELLVREQLHHLVVLDGARVVGVVSERDLAAARDPALRIERTVGELMTRGAVTATPRTSVKDAANIMRGRSLGCLPIMEEGVLVGIVTVTDLLALLGRGAMKPSPRGQRKTLPRRGPPERRPGDKARAAQGRR